MIALTQTECSSWQGTQSRARVDSRAWTGSVPARQPLLLSCAAVIRLLTRSVPLTHLLPSPRLDYCAVEGGDKVCVCDKNVSLVPLRPPFLIRPRPESAFSHSLVPHKVFSFDWSSSQIWAHNSVSFIDSDSSQLGSFHCFWKLFDVKPVYGEGVELLRDNLLACLTESAIHPYVAARIKHVFGNGACAAFRNHPE